jgi:hypothetical protein
MSNRVMSVLTKSILTLGLLAGVLAGCGGSSGSDGTGGAGGASAKGGTMGSAGASGAGTGGVQGAAGARGNSTGGTPGSAGASGTSTACAVCDKAQTCCQAAAPKLNLPSTYCTFSSATCNSQPSADQATYASDCQMVLTTGATVAASSCQ